MNQTKCTRLPAAGADERHASLGGEEQGKQEAGRRQAEHGGPAELRQNSGLGAAEGAESGWGLN